MGRASQHEQLGADASNTGHEGNLPTNKRFWEPISDGRQVYESQLMFSYLFRI